MRVQVGARAVEAVNPPRHRSRVQPCRRGKGERLNTPVQAVAGQGVVRNGLPTAAERRADPRAYGAESYEVGVRGRGRAPRVGRRAGDGSIEQHLLARGQGDVYRTVGVPRAAVGGAPDAASNVSAKDSVGVVPVDDCKPAVAARRIEPGRLAGEALPAVILRAGEQHRVLGRMLA